MSSRDPHTPRPRRSGATPDRAAIEAMLAPWIHDPQDRSFVARCLGDEGPPHHALANVLMVAMLDELLRRLGDGP